MNRLALLGMASAAALASAAPAVAGTEDFAACDGYPAPGKKTDGIVRGGLLWGLASTTADFRREQGRFGATALAPCDAALADTRLLPGYWLRRAHLMQSKALHQIISGSYRDALATLDASDAVGKSHDDRYFGQSLGIGNDALRGLALYRLGQSNESDAALKRVETARPYAPSLARLARTIRMMGDQSRAGYVALLKQGAPQEPDLIKALFWMAIAHDDFSSAVTHSRQLRFELPRQRGGWVIEGADLMPYEQIEQRAQVSGATAYALLATGDDEGSIVAMAAAREDVANATQRPPMPKSGKLSKRVQEDYGRRIHAGNKATIELDNWDKAIALRRKASGQTLMQLMTELEASDVVDDISTMSDIIRQPKAANQQEEAERRAILTMIENAKDSARSSSSRVDVASLFDMLPRPETSSMQPKMQREGGNFLRSDLNGYAVRTNEGSDMITVRFGSATGSAAMVEEAAMLAAARHAQGLGMDAFLIDARMLLQRTTKQVGLYASGGSIPSGYETRLGIRPVKANENADNDWRLMRTADVIAALGPRFADTR